MTDYGMRLRRADGSIKMDGFTRGALFMEILTCQVSQNGSKSYPRVPAGALFYFVSKTGNHKITVDYDSTGAARVNWTSPTYVTSGDTVLYVFANSLLRVDSYGVLIKNSYGDTMVDQNCPSPQFAVTLALSAAATANYTTPEGYTVYLHTTNSFNDRDSSDRIVLVAMPDSGAADTWYQLRTESVPSGSGYTSITVAIYTKSATYSVPTVHVYAINNPIPSTDSYGMRIRDASQKLTFDSGAECVTVKDALTVAYPDPGSAGNTYTLSFTSLPGVSIPYYYHNVQSGSSSTRYNGAARRSGNQITFRLMTDATSSGTVQSYEIGVQAGRYCPVVDLSALGPAANPGNGGGSTLAGPVFTTQPYSQTGTAGSTLTFSVAVSGNPAPTLQWYCRGVAVGTGATTYTATVASGDYNVPVYCVASNSLGNAQSNTALYSEVAAPPPFQPVGISSSPASETVSVGDTASFSVGVTGDGPFAYNWYKNGAFVSSNASYSFVASSSDNGASIYCTVTNGGGAYSATSGTARLTVNEVLAPQPVFSTQPTSITTTVGASVTFSASASNTTLYSWYRDGADAGTGPTCSPDTSVQGSFTYFCRAWDGNDVYQNSTSATLTVNAATVTTFQSYRNPPDYVTSDQGSGSWSIWSGSSDSGDWANGSGDGSLYDVMATMSAGGIPSSPNIFGTWYDLGSVQTYSHVNDTRATEALAFTWQVRLRSSGMIVSSGSVNISIYSNFT